jgi:DNA-binding response OmpR family regulator
VECTTSELRLLKELVMNADVVLSRNTLLERLYDVDGAFIDDNTLSVYLKRLRDKLGEDADYIETVRGVGYRFRKNRNK